MRISSISFECATRFLSKNYLSAASLKWPGHEPFALHPSDVGTVLVVLAAFRLWQKGIPLPFWLLRVPSPHHLDWCVKTLETGIIEGTGYDDP